MRTISAAEDAVLTATGGMSVRHRVKVKDSGATFRDLSTYPGFDMCLEANWKEDVDSPGMEANIVLKREVEKISLGPLLTQSPVNRAFAYPGSYAALIDIGREVQIEVAITPDGIPPVAGDWKLQFHGYIDDIDPGAGPHITMRCSDLQAKLRDTWIERERSYAFAQGANATKGCIIWRPSDTLAVGERAQPTDAKKNGHFYRITAITTGITGSTEPTWPTGGGSTVVDGGVTWTESGSTSISAGTAVETVIQQIIDDNLGAGVFTLSTPVSPSWALKAWKQDRTNVWDAIKRLADQIGWDLRFKWDSGSSTFKLTLYTPNRTNTTADRTWSAAQRYPVGRMPTQIQGIRNAVQVVYSDSADLDGAGRPKRKTIVRTDGTSITAYGRRFCEVAESDSSNIDSTAEAQTLADAILADLKSPVCEHECDVPFFRFAELTDLYQWGADATHYDNAQKLAVTGYTHKITGKTARTTLQTRGKPSTAFMRWHSRLNNDQHALDLDNSSSVTISSSDVVGGTRFNITNSENKGSLPLEYELHLDPSSGFTPSNSTIKSQGSSTNVLVPDLIPGKTYYAKVIPTGHNRSRIVRGQPSAELTVTPGRASAGHVSSGIAIGDYPLNGGFETRLDAAGMPDHWSLWSTAVLTTDVDVMEDANGVSGTRYARLKTTSGAIRAAVFPIINEAMESNRFGSLYRMTWWVKNGASNSAGAQYDAIIRVLDSSGAEINTLTGVFAADLQKGHWIRQEQYFAVSVADATARSIQLQFKGRSGATFQVDLDECRIQYVGTDWYTVGSTTKFTDNYEAVPGFTNSWVNYGGTDQVVGFRRDQFGRVHLRGIMKNGTVTASAFTLPVGFRPPNTFRFAVAQSNTFGQVDIAAAGTVTPQIGTNTWFDLTNISFMTY